MRPSPTFIGAHRRVHAWRKSLCAAIELAETLQREEACADACEMGHAQRRQFRDRSRSTGRSTMSASNCMSWLLRVGPPSTISRSTGAPLDRNASTTSAIW